MASASGTLSTLTRLSIRLARPARTLPGPISRAWVIPESAMSAMVCSQRTGPSICLTSRPLTASASWFGSAVTFATTGKLELSQRGFDGAGSGGHQCTVKRRAHLERNGLELLGAGQDRCAIDGSLVPRNHDLPWGVGVGWRQHVPLGGFSAQGFDRLAIAAHHGCHSAFAFGNGLLHGAA